MRIARVPAPPPFHAGLPDAGPRHAVESVPWLWFEGHDGVTPFEAWFERAFRLDAPAEGWIEITAGERFEFLVDDEPVARGPDRSDPDHAGMTRVALALPAGRHRLEVRVLFLGEAAPLAQMSVRPGLGVAAGGFPVDLSTASPEWRVAPGAPLRLRPPLAWTFHVVGPGFVLEAAERRERAWTTPVSSLRRWHGYGTLPPFESVRAADLPEQLRRPRPAGRLRALRPAGRESEPWVETLRGGDGAAWQAFAAGCGEVEIPVGQAVEALLDLEDYVCAYPELAARGEGGVIELLWEECLFTEAPPAGRTKTHRDRIEGLFFRGFGDELRTDDHETVFRPPWWRAGRYLLVRARAGDGPLRLGALRLLETRYPFDLEPSFDARPDGWLPLQRLLLRGLECSAHETLVDAPFYEQMCYGGDARLELLCLYQASGDDRLARRTLELFDWSRSRCGWPASRYPSRRHQVIPTYGLTWILAVHDHLWWRGGRAFVRSLLPGLRATADLWLALPQPDGTVVGPPGWAYVDSTPGWPRGVPTGTSEGGSASVNLLLVLALRALSEMESVVGEPDRARPWRAAAERILRAVRRRHGFRGSDFLRETPDRSERSEHALALNLLCGAPGRPATVRALASREGLVRANLYFEFYVGEALARIGRTDVLLERQGPWQRMLAQGLRTPPEYDDDTTRSDCHGWASHPLFHLHASLAGVRPAAAGYERVRIRPAPADRTWLRSRTAHPRGAIEVEFGFDDSGLEGFVRLPPETPGELVWAGQAYALGPGETSLQIRAGEPPPSSGRCATGPCAR